MGSEMCIRDSLQVPDPLKSGCDLCILRADAPMPNGMGAESPPEKTRPGPIKHTMQLHSIIIGNDVYVKYLAL